MIIGQYLSDEHPNDNRRAVDAIAKFEFQIVANFEDAGLRQERLDA